MQGYVGSHRYSAKGKKNPFLPQGGFGFLEPQGTCMLILNAPIHTCPHALQYTLKTQ